MLDNETGDNALTGEVNAFGLWLQQGIDAGWVSSPFCEAHDGVPFTEKEIELSEEYEWDILDMCVHSVRLYGVKDA